MTAIASACPSCAGVLRPGANFCPACGDTVTAAPGGRPDAPAAACRGCGRSIPETARFCPGCGLDAISSAVPPRPPPADMATPPDAVASAAPTREAPQPRIPERDRSPGPEADLRPEGAWGIDSASRQPVAPTRDRPEAFPAQPASSFAAGNLRAWAALTAAVVVLLAFAGAGGYLLLGDSDAQGSSESSGADTPEGAFRRHWELVDKGAYEDAADLFHPTWPEKTADAWVEYESGHRPGVDLDSFTASPRSGPAGGVAKLDAQVVTANTAGDDHACRRFGGWVRMQRAGGEWRYRPGQLDDEGRPTFRELEELSEDDPRCQRARE